MAYGFKLEGYFSIVIWPGHVERTPSRKFIRGGVSARQSRGYRVKEGRQMLTVLVILWSAFYLPRASFVTLK